MIQEGVPSPAANLIQRARRRAGGFNLASATGDRSNEGVGELGGGLGAELLRQLLVEVYARLLKRSLTVLAGERQRKLGNGVCELPRELREAGHISKQDALSHLWLPSSSSSSRSSPSSFSACPARRRRCNISRTSRACPPKPESAATVVAAAIRCIFSSDAIADDTKKLLGGMREVPSSW